MAMISKVRTLDRRLLTRRCVSCGYDGASVSRLQTARCPRCGCDLLDRPPRSYAEMEGLLGRPMIEVDMEAARQTLADEQRSARLIHRWLALLFLGMLGVLAIAYLAAALNPV
jgi:hypothetical protein